jgi:hypothetical protein
MSLESFCDLAHNAVADSGVSNRVCYQWPCQSLARLAGPQKSKAGAGLEPAMAPCREAAFTNLAIPPT